MTVHYYQMTENVLSPTKPTWICREGHGSVTRAVLTLNSDGQMVPPHQKTPTRREGNRLVVGVILTLTNNGRQVPCRQQNPLKGKVAC